MPTRKAGKKGAAKKGGAKARKSAKKTAATQKVLTQDLISRIVRRREWVMYGIPIRDVIAAGDPAQMRRAAQIARTHLADVQKSLNRLEDAISSAGK